MNQAQTLIREQAQMARRIEALETADTSPVVARYTTNAGQSITQNVTTVVDFEDAVLDTRSAVTTGANWVFTAPVAGPYRVSTHLVFDSSGAWATGSLLSIDVYKNGAFYSRLWHSDNYQSGADANGGGCDIVAMDIDDTLDIRVRHATTAAKTLQATSGYNWVAIELITY